jgi:serine/threonine-protein kinase
VFGLGAILCEILTGQPPFPGKNAEAMHKAQTAQLDNAFRHLGDCGADAELIDLARRCLAAEPMNRPQHAGAVAAAVTAYQNSVAERLRQAELTHAAEVARTEEAQATAAQERRAREAAQARVVAEQRARRRSVAVTALISLFLLVAVSGGMWLQRYYADTRQGVGSMLNTAATLRDAARWAEAREVLEQAEGRLGGMFHADLRRQVKEAQADLTLANRLDDIRQQRFQVVSGKRYMRSTDQDFAAAFADAGLWHETDAQAMAARIRASAIRELLVDAMDDWAILTSDPKRRAWLLDVARRVDPDPRRDSFRDQRVWGDQSGLVPVKTQFLNDEQLLAQQKPQFLVALATVDAWTGGDPVPLLMAGHARYPDNFWLDFALGYAFCEARRWDEGIQFYRAALTARPSAVAAYVNLGSALIEIDQPDQALDQYLRAIELDPNDAAAHCGLSLARLHQCQRAVAQRSFGRWPPGVMPLRQGPPQEGLLAAAIQNMATQALRNVADVTKNNYRPPWDIARQYLGPEDLIPAAIQDARRAIELDPNFAQAHNRLGAALWANGIANHDNRQCDEALKEHHRAIELDAKDARPHNDLGTALRDREQIDGAIQELRRAVGLDPKCAAFHTNLGLALRAKGDINGAIQEFRCVVELDPKDARSHYNLGKSLHDNGKLTAALQEYCIALELDPKFYQARVALVKVLHSRGEFAESQKAHYGHGPYLYDEDTSNFVGLDGKLSLVLQRKLEPDDDAECIALASLCQAPPRKLLAASCWLYSQAFASRRGAKLAGDMKAQHRYHAACVAALAGCCKGNDAYALNEEQRARLRQQSMEWLRADLAQWTEQAASDKPSDRNLVRMALKDWQGDPDLTCVRDKAALEKMPVEEREGWQKLWAEVGVLLQKIGE